MSVALAGGFFTTSATWEAPNNYHSGSISPRSMTFLFLFGVPETIGYLAEVSLLISK
jgi:hypothetical protein